MDYHQNARLTIYSRERLARKVLYEGLTLKLAAASFNVSQKTAAKWTRRFEQGGADGVAGTAAPGHADPIDRPQPLSWKKFLLFAGCAGTGGGSPARSNSAAPR